MKKIFKLIFTYIVVIMLCAGYTTCHATEVSTDTFVVTKDIAAEESTEENISSETVESSVYHTFYGRVLEYYNSNKTEIIGLAGDGLLLVGLLVVRSLFKKKTREISTDIKIVKGDAAGTATAQSSVVSAVNCMIDGYNDMRTAYEKYELVEDDRNKLVGAVMVQNTAILEILSLVYVHNKNIPQGVKDLVTLKYANCQKALDNDAFLRAVVESVREKIDVTQLQANDLDVDLSEQVEEV